MKGVSGLTDKWVVITTINPPTPAVRAYVQTGWNVVVVGDYKTPAGWHCEGVTFLPLADQERMGFSLARKLPLNHYSRKMLGYLYAMREGAEVIADADDDTTPNADWGHPEFDGSWMSLYGPPKFVNVYRHFSKDRVWPRGFPLRYIHSTTVYQQAGSQRPVGVWQSLVDGDPDVDAIYRLTVGYQATFKDKMSPIVLEPGTFCPFNSQNTFWRKETFPLMYLPTSVSSRFSDILRSYVAQPAMWAKRMTLGFTSPNATQKRNKHDDMSDFEDEVPMYVDAEAVALSAENATRPERTMTANLVGIYSALDADGVAFEKAAVEAWIQNLS